MKLRNNDLNNKNDLPRKSSSVKLPGNIPHAERFSRINLMASSTIVIDKESQKFFSQKHRDLLLITGRISKFDNNSNNNNYNNNNDNASDENNNNYNYDNNNNNNNNNNIDNNDSNK